MKKSPIVRVGFDFDKVFVNYPQFIPDKIVDRLYKKKSKKLTYRFPGSVERQIRVFSHHHLFRTPIIKNINVLKKIAKSGTPTYLISSRFGFLKNRTEYWIRKYQLNRFFQEIHFNYQNDQPHKFKEQTITRLQITHYIDDDFDLIRYLSKQLPHIHFYWLTGKKKSDENIPENVSIIQSLEDLPKNVVFTNKV